MDNKTTTIARNSAAGTAQAAGTKKGNGAGALAVDAAMDKLKRTTKSPTEATARGYTQDDIALRAYFISEKRNEQGLPGTQEEDWLEAERQLIEENQVTSSPKTRKTRR
jgi:hypothetical protein